MDESMGGDVQGIRRWGQELVAMERTGWLCILQSFLPSEDLTCDGCTGFIFCDLCTDLCVFPFMLCAPVGEDEHAYLTPALLLTYKASL